MLDETPTGLDAFDITPSVRLDGRVAGIYSAVGDGFASQAVEALRLTFEGIEGDFHAGYTRRSGGREPWYPRGTEMRNERQLSVVAPDELAEIASRMALDAVLPEWIGANLLIDGVKRLSMLPAGTLMFFAGGVTLKIDAQNGPCRLSGRSIAENVGMNDIKGGSLLFPKAAKRLRGLVAWVEKPGIIENGEAVSLKLPEQWIYR